ncbi:MAG: endopeptidase La, partial [Acidimicrobiales bacterium]
MPKVDTLTLPLLPLPGGVVFPGMVLTMSLEDAEANDAFEAAKTRDSRVILVPKIGHRYARVGTLAVLEQLATLPGGGHTVGVRALARVLIGRGVMAPHGGLTGPASRASWVEAEEVVLEEGAQDTPDVADLAREYRAVIGAILETRGAHPLAQALRSVTDPGTLADTVAYLPDLSVDQRLELLETIEVEPRLRLALTRARETLGELTLREHIKTEVSEGMERTQREFLLRQQMAAIRKELGQAEGSEDEIDGYRRRIAEAALSDSARAFAEREVDRLERMSDSSPEQGWVRTWLDTVLELPWGVRSPDVADVAKARAVLDADHHGLKDVKDRIVEYLAVRQLRVSRGLEPASGKGAGAILVLVGPPGVGKTSLGESVARALGRSFSRVSLGGIRDEAEIRGHRRTYVGAMPGRIVRAIRESKTMNPVIMLDEVDKVGADWRGDPSSALLEVLDPAQNHTFRDHYLEIDLDLSDVLFIGTANVVDTIPGPLLDRMELIHLDGYTEEEKVVIATQHLLPRQREAAGLRPGEVEVTEAAIRAVIEDYTREAGVRNLERGLSKVLRKVASHLAEGAENEGTVVDASIVAGALSEGAVSEGAVSEGAVSEGVVSEGAVSEGAVSEGAVSEGVVSEGVVSEEGAASEGVVSEGGVSEGVEAIRVDVADINTYLGRPRFKGDNLVRAGLPGVATGLAVTGAGGDVLAIEAAVVPAGPGSSGQGGGLTLTGQLGDVMKESASIALSWVRSHSADWGVEPSMMGGQFHLHVPAGAVPKDGPSAGITMVTALASLL